MMLQSFQQLFGERALRKQLVRRGILWTLVVVVILGLGAYFTQREKLGIALGRARDSFQKDVTTRLWVTQRGGVYVPLDEKTPANPYLWDLPNREITTTTGKVYTLVNPAYMTRMLHELGAKEFGLRGHITSLRPIRPENAADAWEQKALQRFETGAREYWEEETSATRPQLRYMGALITVEGCLRCHASQGYRVGDVRGGISVTVPLDQGLGLIGGMQNPTILLGTGLLWLLGLGVILMAGRWNLGLLQDRQRAQEALRESQESFASLFEHAVLGIYRTSAEGQIVLANQALCAMLGYPSSEALAQCDLENNPTYSVSRFREELAKTARVAGLESLWTRPDGTTVNLRESVRSVHDASGNLIYFEGIVEDITERKQAEEALQASRRRLTDIIDFLPDATLAVDKERRIIIWNKAIEKMTGIPAAEMLGRGDYAYTVPFYGEARSLLLDLVFAGDETIAGRYSNVLREGETLVAEAFCNALYQGKGAWVFLKVSPLHDQAGNVTGAIESIRDVTVQKQAEAELRESEAQKRALLSTIPDLIFRNRRDGEFLAIHAPDPSLLFVPVETLLHRRASEVLPMPFAGRFAKAIDDALDLHAIQELTYTMSIGGEARPFEARVVPCTADTVITIVRDMTEHRRAEEQQRQLQAQLQQTQKMESLGSLAGGVAHDMNNVLGAILGMASTQLESQPEGSSARKAFDTISRAAVRGGQMVKALLSFARQSPAEERELEINEILREEVRLLEHTTLAKVDLHLDLAPDLRPMRGDASALNHAFMNLCVNAVEAMAENGTLTLRTRNVDDDWIEVLVEDTGSGMPKAVLEKALDPFFTTKEQGKGTGLGLSMVYSAVKAHRGQLEIHSEPGHGTRVRLRFPACEALPQAPEPAVEAPSESPLRGRIVLLVDDDELIRGSMQAVLEALGHSATVVASGEEALAKLEVGFQPEVVILDMNMPGLGGSGTLPRLRALRPTLPVLLATGRADQTALDLVEAHPFVTLLSKPFSMKDLQKHLEALGRG